MTISTTLNFDNKLSEIFGNEKLKIEAELRVFHSQRVAINSCVQVVVDHSLTGIQVLIIFPVGDEHLCAGVYKRGKPHNLTLVNFYNKINDIVSINKILRYGRLV
jgi:hypothetical protein